MRTHVCFSVRSKAPAGFEQVSHRAELGPPDEALVRVIEEEHADLLVVGTGGRGAMRSILLGSATRCCGLAVPGHGRLAQATD
jgi:nucleotide-binding universal stress UspA family protein